MQKLIVANWKMNGNLEKVRHDLYKYAIDPVTNKSNVIISLPSIFLSVANDIIKQTAAKYKLSVQDISQFEGFGAYTGELSAKMVKEFEVSYIIVGHSERRTYLNESGSVLAHKLDNCLLNNLLPIFCIGEPLNIRQSNNHLHFLSEQLEVLLQVKTTFNRLVIAYEPLWSIGTGVIPSMEDIIEVVNLITAFVQSYLPHVKITTLYGGSVSKKNVDKILALDCIGGVLVGGASLIVDEFTTICSV